MKATPLPLVAVVAGWIVLAIVMAADIYRPAGNPFGPPDPFLTGNVILSAAVILYYLLKKRIDMAGATVALAFILGSIIAPNCLRARAGGQLTACKSNLKNIGTAMEMYASENEKHYPPALSSVTPDYLKTLPTCASAGKMTYTYIHSADMECYTAWCTEKRHPGTRLAPGFPQYDSVNGLYENAGQFR